MPDYNDITNKLNYEVPNLADNLACDLMDAYLDHRRSDDGENLGTDGLTERLYNAAKARAVKILGVEGLEPSTDLGKRRLNQMIERLTGINVDKLEYLFRGVSETSYSLIEQGVVNEARSALSNDLSRDYLNEIETSDDISGLRRYVEQQAGSHGIILEPMDTMRGALSEYLRVIDIMKRARGN